MLSRSRPGELTAKLFSVAFRRKPRKSMSKIQRLGYVLLLIGIVTITGYSQETASEYVRPAEAVPKGSALRMQVQLLNPGEQTKQYAVIFFEGDEAFAG